ncbi:MAG: IS1595 family transposase [Candidatus Niyogibacteria bacterium]|nr:IS1595 family transposase [Candidatus Niyogibacteria bacterium]
MKKYTRKDFERDYPTNEACLHSIFLNRYGKRYACPSCKKRGKFHRIAGRKRYDCQCGFSVHPLAGTIFHKSDTSLKDWFWAIFLFASSRNGVAAKELERQLGMTYKCAWRMGQQIRLLFEQNNIKFYGEVEADETYVGGKGKHNKRGRGAEHKTPVFGIASRKGNVKARVVENVKSKTIMPIIQQSVRKQSIIFTDEFKSYNRVGSNGYSHETIQHGIKEYVRGKIHTNTIEGFWSQLKRSLDGTHHAVSPKYLQRYVDEFVYRWNQRLVSRPMFSSILGRAVMPV